MKSKSINNKSKQLLTPKEKEKQEAFLNAISKVNQKSWYKYDFSDLDVITLFENEKK